MAKEFCVGKDTYRFDAHRQGYGYVGYIAVNVKCHIYLKLTDVQEAQLARLDALDPTGNRSFEDRLYSHCWDSVQMDWWENARQEADLGGLGKIDCGGRQGGWLVMLDWPVSKVDELIEETEIRCVHCDQIEDTHVNEQCLFASTHWSPMVCLTRDAKATLDSLSEYLSSMDSLVEHAEESVIHDFAYQLQVRYDEEFPQLELFEVLGAKHE